MLAASALAGVTALMGAGWGTAANAAVNGSGTPPSYTTFTMDCGSGPMLVAAIGSGSWDSFLVVGTTTVFVPFTKDFTITTPDGTFTLSEIKSPGVIPPGAVTCTRDNWFGDVHLVGTQVGLLE